MHAQTAKLNWMNTKLQPNHYHFKHGFGLNELITVAYTAISRENYELSEKHFPKVLSARAEREYRQGIGNAIKSSVVDQSHADIPVPLILLTK